MLSLILIVSSLISIISLLTVTQVELVQVFVQQQPQSTKTDAIAQTVVTSSHGKPSTNSAYEDIYNYNGEHNLNATFAKLMVSEHNLKRKKHRAQPLGWNSTLFEFAASYASSYDCSGVLTHSGNAFYGENLAIGYSPVGAIDAWYKEGNTYDYSKHDTYNHFTAMVWNDTTAIGCQTRYCSQVWGSYIICSYYPPGNIVGQSLENVLSS